MMLMRAFWAVLNRRPERPGFPEEVAEHQHADQGCGNRDDQRHKDRNNDGCETGFSPFVRRGAVAP